MISRQQSRVPSWNEQRRRSFQAFYALFTKYWRVYGGWKALTSSPYFLLSIALTAILSPFWSQPDWWEISLSFLPTAMGFSLAAFAMILAFGNEAFITILATKAEKRDRAAFERISNAFFHFLVVQFIAFITALVCKAYYLPVPRWMIICLHWCGISEGGFVSLTQFIFWPVAFALTIYSVVCGLTASVRVYRLSHIFVNVIEGRRDSSPKGCETNPPHVSNNTGGSQTDGNQKTSDGDLK